MKFVSKRDSGLRPPQRRVVKTLSKPSTGHWNGPTVYVQGQPVFDHRYCASLWRGIQAFHMDSRGWSDIAYNFGICQHGYVFEGRGLNVVNGANGTNAGNQTSHAVMVMAGPDNPFTLREKAAFRDCVKYISEKTSAPNAAIGHRDHKSTECPGNARYDWIRGGMKLDGASPAPTPPNEKGPLMALSDKEQDELLAKVRANDLRLQQIQDILLGDRPDMGDTQERQLASLKRIEEELK